MSWLSRRTPVQRRTLFLALIALVVLVMLHAPFVGYSTWCDQMRSIASSLADPKAGLLGFVPPGCTDEEDYASILQWRSDGALVPFLASLGQLLGWVLGVLVIAGGAWIIFREEQ